MSICQNYGTWSFSQLSFSLSPSWLSLPGFFCLISISNFDSPEIGFGCMSDFIDPWIIMISCQYLASKVHLMFTKTRYSHRKIPPSNWFWIYIGGGLCAPNLMNLGTNLGQIFTPETQKLFQPHGNFCTYISGYIAFLENSAIPFSEADCPIFTLLSVVVSPCHYSFCLLETIIKGRNLT